MENIGTTTTSGNSLVGPQTMDWKTGMIIFLVLIILLFTSLGTFASQFVSDFLYSTGWFIGKTSDVVANTAETGIDIANGAVHNGSDLLIKASNIDGRNPPSSYQMPQSVINVPEDKKEENKSQPKEPEPDNTTNPIQNPISSGKSNWCLVGEYQGKRGCIAISDADKCMSGQIFPSQQACLNPTFTQNVRPNMMTPNGIPPRIDLTALPNTYPSFEQQQFAEYQIKNVPRNT